MQKAQRNRSKIIKISVTREDIRKARNLKYHGKLDAACQCPVALAMRRKFPTAEVYYTSFRIPSGKFTLPDSVRQFIHRFDAGGFRVKPFSFLLKLP
jgi:hypothetical protein